MTRKYHLTKPHKDTVKWQARAKKIYQFYLNFLAENGKLPTLEEVGKKFSISRSRAGQLLKRLEKDGYVLKLARGKRVYLPKSVLKKQFQIYEKKR